MESELVAINGDDIIQMIAESHMIHAGAIEACLGLSMAKQAELIEGLDPDPNLAVMVFRNFLIRVLRGQPRLSLRVITGGKAS